MHEIQTMTCRGVVRWLTALSVIALLVAGCGKTSSSSSSSSSSSAPPPATAGTGGAGSSSVTNYLTYVHGRAGSANPKLAPVYIGFINQQGGQAPPDPLATTGAKIAVKYINSELGGIDGHPLALKTCFIRSAEEEGTICGQQMLADKSVSVVDEGAVGLGIQSFWATIGTSKPVIGGVTITPVEAPHSNAVILFGDTAHILAPFGTYARQVLHAKTAALLYESFAGITPGIRATVDSLHKLGVKVKMVGYDDRQTDMVGPLTIAGARTADIVVFPGISPAGCVNMAKGLKTLGITDAKKIVAVPLCLNGQVAAGLGGDFPKWTYLIASSLLGDRTDPGMPPYQKVMAKYGSPAVAPDPWVIVSFGQVLTTARFLNELGYGHITPQAVLRKARTFPGPVALGAPALQCGKYPSAPGVCNDRAQFFRYQGKGVFVKTAGWLQAP